MAIDLPISMYTPLFTFVETDDIALANQKDIIWFHLLREFDWYPYQLLAAKYYDALFRRNLAAAEASATATCGAPNPETKDEATKRALRIAVEQGVGVLVSSETLVENNQLINDKIYTAVAGYVSTYDVLEDNGGADGLPTGRNCWRSSVPRCGTPCSTMACW